MLDDKVVKIVGEHLKAYRKAKKLSLRELSDRCGVPKTTIARYENGADGDIDKYNKICDALGINFRELVMDVQLAATKDLLNSIHESRLELEVKERGPPR